MIRRYVIKKLSVTTLALLIILLYIAYPVKNSDDFSNVVNYLNEDNLSYVYLNDNNNYLTLTSVYLEDNDIKKSILEKIEYLKGNKSIKNFTPILPNDVKVNSIDIKDNTLTIDFSKELLNISEDKEESMIEGLIFTMSENSKIDSLIIKVEGSILDKLPHSKKSLPTPLTRKYGINKKYDIDSINNITCTTIYYLNNIDDENYYTPVSLYTNQNKEKIDIIIEELKSTKVYQNSLKSLLNEDASLVSSEIDDNIMYLVFNEGIVKDVSDEILESVKYTISSSVKENYDVDDVVIKIK